MRRYGPWALAAVVSVILGLGALGGLKASDERLSRTFSDVPVGATAVAKGNMRLRDSAPEDVAALYSKGKLIDYLHSGELVRINGVKELPSIWGNQTWLRVERLDPGAGPKEGWVYFGGKDYFGPVVEDAREKLNVPDSEIEPKS